MKRSWRMLVVLGILMIVFNVIVFAVPFPKTEIFWLSYVFTMVAFIVQWPISIFALNKEETVKSKFYGWPIMQVGLFYMLATLICTALFTILSTVLLVPLWIQIICYVVLTAIAAIGLISADSVRNFVEQGDVKLTTQIYFMKRLYAEADALRKAAADDAIKRTLSKMADEIRYSDPVSRPDMESTEARLYEIFEVVRNGVAEKDKDKVLAASEQFHQQLVMRNSMCKAGKH